MTNEEMEIIALICAMASMMVGIILCSVEIFKLGTFLILTGGLTSMAIVVGDPILKIVQYEYDMKSKKGENK
jgi:hypothetical protein